MQCTYFIQIVGTSKKPHFPEWNKLFYYAYSKRKLKVTTNSNFVQLIFKLIFKPKTTPGISSSLRFVLSDYKIFVNKQRAGRDFQILGRDYKSSNLRMLYR